MAESKALKISLILREGVVCGLEIETASEPSVVFFATDQVLWPGVRVGPFPRYQDGQGRLQDFERRQVFPDIRQRDSGMDD